MASFRVFLSAVILALASVNQAWATFFTVDLHQSATPLSSLAAAKALIASTAPVASSLHAFIDLDDLGDGTRGRSGIDLPFPVPGDLTFAAVHITGAFKVPTGGTYTLLVNHDDGMELAIDGSVLSSFAGVTDNIDTLGVATLTPGRHSLDLIVFEQAGGFSSELWIASGSQSGFNPSFSLLRAAPEPGLLSLLGMGLVAVALHRRRSRSR